MHDTISERCGLCRSKLCKDQGTYTVTANVKDPGDGQIELWAGSFVPFFLHRQAKTLS